MNAKHSAVSPLMATLSGHVAGALGRALPPEVIEKAKAHLLDTIAAIVSGSQLQPGLQGVAHARRLGGTPEAQVIAADFLSSAGNAAFANGMMAHADETDDPPQGLRDRISAAASSAGRASPWPETTAPPEARHCCGRSCSATTSAAAPCCRLIRSVSIRPVTAPTPLPVYSARRRRPQHLPRFRAEQVRWTFSYAAQQAAGITSWRRALEHVEKAFVFAGMPARNGVESAMLVASGFTGVNDVFTGAQNFFITFGQDPKPDLLVEELGERFEIMRTTIKKWSVGSPAQSVLDAVQVLMQTNQFSHGDIAEIAIRMFPLEIDTVDDRAMPDISLQHLVAVLLDRRNDHLRVLA